MRTVQVRVAGVPSGLPAASTARTANVCVPLARFAYVAGLAHACQAPLSSEHSKRAPSVDVKVNVARGLLTGLDEAGPAVSCVCGRLVSCVHAYGAVGALLSTPAVVRTGRECAAAAELPDRGAAVRG